MQYLKLDQQKTIRKNKEVFDAWLRGEEIEEFSDGIWMTSHFPRWSPKKKYRIKEKEIEFGDRVEGFTMKGDDTFIGRYICETHVPYNDEADIRHIVLPDKWDEVVEVHRVELLEKNPAYKGKLKEMNGVPY